MQMIRKGNGIKLIITKRDNENRTKEIENEEQVICPICGSKEITSQIIMFGYGTVDVNTLEVYGEPDDWDFDFSDIYEYQCTNCQHEW